MSVDGIKSEWSSGSLIFTEQVSAAAPLIQVGKFVSATTGAGMVLNNTKTQAFGMYADDGGVALSTSAVKVSWSRLLITTATNTAGSAFGHEAQVKILGVNYNQGGNAAGLWGYLETITGATVTGTAGLIRAGVMASCDVPSGATIAASSFVSCIGCGGDLGGTHTGDAVVMHVVNPSAGTFDAFAKFDTATGACTAQSGGSLTITYKIPVIDPAGNTIYIAAGTIA